MPKTDPTSALMKRLQKMEQAHARLANVTARIRVQADTVADLVRVAKATRTTGTRARRAGTSARRAGGAVRPRAGRI